MRKVPTVIELFSGCGGISAGLLQAGFNVRLAVDVNARAIDTLRYNHEHVGTRGLVADIRALSGEDLLAVAGLSEPPNVIVGGPPCQPFSIVGKRAALADKRGDLVFEFV